MTDRSPRGLRRRSSWTPTDLAVAGVAIALAAVVPLVLTHAGGALAVPRSDDWSYLLTLFTWRDRGVWDFNDWVSMTLVGQVLLTVPIDAVTDHSIVAARVLVAGLGAVGTIAMYRAGVGLGLPRALAALATVSLAASPMWGALAASYMTDVPAFAFVGLALAAGLRALREPRIHLGWYAAAVAAAVFAVSIRQYAAVGLVALAMVGCVAAVRGDARARRAVVATLAVGGLLVVALFAWWSGVPNRLALEPRVPNGASVRLAVSSLGGFLRLTGLVLVPLVVALGPGRIVAAARRSSARATLVCGGGVGALLAVSYALSPTVPFVGNYVDRRGVLADDIIHGDRPDIVPRAVFEVLALVGSLAAIALVLATVPALHRVWTRVREDGFTARSGLRSVGLGPLLLGLLAVGYLVAYEMAILVRLPIFDRYALAAIPVVGLGIAHLTQAGLEPEVTAVATGASPVRSRWAIVTLGVLTVLGAAFTVESAEFDAGRWAAGEAAVAAGLEARDVDAGYEWNGWHRRTAPGVRNSIAERRRLRRLYREGLCVQVVIDPVRPPTRAIATVEVTGWFRPPATLYVVPTGQPCASGRDVPPPLAATSTR